MKKIKLYSVYTEEVINLKRNFENTFQDDWEVMLDNWGKFGEEGDYATSSFKSFTRKKIQFIVDKIKQNWDDIIIWSDIDIQFFGQCTSLIMGVLADKDILFLAEHWPKKEINTGFIVIRCNSNSLSLFENVLSNNFEELKYHEQSAINGLLQSNAISIKWDILPKQFWAMSHGGNPPIDVVLHHANCTRRRLVNGQRIGSLELKLKQMKEIRSYIEIRRKFKLLYYVELLFSFILRKTSLKKV
jgi:hypothetical protein